MIDPVKGAMIRTMFLQVGSQTAAGFVVTGYMVGTAWAFTSSTVITAWTVATLATIMGRWTTSRRFLRQEQPEQSLQRWANIYLFFMLVSGVLWGASFLAFAHPDQPITVALTLSCLYSVAAGSTPSCAYHPPAILAIVVPIFAAVLGKLLLTADFEYVLLGSASALYGVTMIGYCRVQANTLREGFRIRFENVELVEALRVEKEEAESARQQAEQASLAKSQFLAAASHDLRQPLYALGLFSTALEDMRLDTAGRNVARKIQDSIGAMETLFEGLLDLSKLEAGVIQPQFEAVPVDALFDRLSQIFLPLALDRGIELRLRSDGERVWSDPVLLQQVLANLVSNAVRWTHKGGVLIAVRHRGEQLRFEVWDTGPGIDADNLERIFDDYVQLHNPERDRRRGLGLGLSIARRSIALLGARIHVRSQIGRGSVFSFVQPLPSAPAITGAALDHERFAPAVTRRGGLPVLVVEDDADVRFALMTLLQRWGVEVEAVGTADAALTRVVAGAQYGLMLVDYRLAGSLNGIDFIDRMRAISADPPPAVLITGESDPHLLRPAQGEPVPVLQKPVDRKQLRALLALSELDTSQCLNQGWV